MNRNQVLPATGIKKTADNHQITSSQVPEAGLEPAQPQWPKDFHTNLEFAWTMS